MKTTLVAGILGAAGILVAVAFLARSWRSLALLLPLLLYLAIGSLVGPAVPRLAVIRTLSRDRCSVGQEVEVRLRIMNEGPRLAALEIFDNVASSLEVVKGRPHLFLDLRQHEAVEVAYTVAPSVKGEYAIGPLLARTRDALGLRHEEERIEGEATLVVAPRMEDVRKVQVHPHRVRSLMGLVRSRVIGHGLEFFSMRDYEPGDEIRRVNWKASARRDRLLTNEYEAERSGDAILILDARGESEVGPAARSTTELGITATVSLAAKILETRNRVGLIVQRDVLDWVYPGYGRRQLYRIVDALVHVRAGGEWPFEHVTWVLARFFPPDAQVIIVSPLLDRKALDVIADLRGHGFDVLVVSPSPLEVERAMYGEDPYAGIAYRVLKLERDATIQQLRAFADVVDWDPKEPLAVALKGVKPYPRRR
ncbi:MAG TPA: DUF58 domain-containing protein [Thermoplasmata archaeon]|nr:DUF58 domain-containing protein [Thermoplasmata archaeon]